MRSVERRRRRRSSSSGGGGGGGGGGRDGDSAATDLLHLRNMLEVLVDVGQRRVLDARRLRCICERDRQQSSGGFGCGQVPW